MERFIVTAKSARENVAQFKVEANKIAEFENNVMVAIDESSKAGNNCMSYVCSPDEVRLTFIEELNNLGFQTSYIAQEAAGCGFLNVSW